MKARAPKLSEAAWQRQVIQMARLGGWRVAHFRPARRQSGGFSTPTAGDGKGFPDLVLARRGAFTREIIHAELKTDAGKLSPEQLEWQAALGGEVWRPRDFDAVRRRLVGI